MKRGKLFKGSALVVALAMAVTAMPVMATENSDIEPEEENIVLIEDEDFDIMEYSEPKESSDEEDYGAQDIDDLAVDEVTEETEPDEFQSIQTYDVDTEEESELEVIGVVVDPKEVTLNVVGQTKKLTVSVETESGGEVTIEDINWVSSNSSVATVDKDGMVEAVGNGTAEITVSYGGEPYTDTCTVTVSLYNGFNKDPDSDDWYYYSNGKVKDTTDVIQGTVDGKNGWWNVVNGKVTRAETVAHNSNGWWYINSNGMVDFNYNGFAYNSNGWWYCEDGKVTFSKNSVIQDTNKKIDGAASWWYVVGSQVQTDFTGLADYSNSNGWWYIENGKVTFNANTVASNKNGTFYVEGSKVNFSYTGFAKDNNDVWWYCENGKVNSNQNSVILDSGKKIDGAADWWYVVGGQVQSSFTGLAHYSNSNGWWYIRNGKVDFTANTVAQNQNGWWYVLDGKVQFGFTGLANYSNENGWWYIKDGKVDFTANTVAQNKNGWWYVLGGKVQFGFTGLADYSNSNGWWYIKNGKVTFDYTGLAQNKNGWYYIKDSKVDFSKNTVMQGTVNGTNTWWYVVGGKVQTGFTGLANYSNSNGWWYIKNGQVDFTFNGIASNNNGTWLVQNGKVDFNYNGTYTYGGVTYNVKNGKASHPAADIGMDMTMYNKAQSYSSSTKWLILVDVTNCKFGVFQGSYGNWTPYKYWDCTTGAPGSPTCIGSYTIYGKGKSFGDSDHTCYWYSQFNGNYLIHSVLYYPGTYTIKEGRLGMHLSNGCVRLAIDNAKWVYDNVPYSTKVVTYK